MVFLYEGFSLNVLVFKYIRSDGLLNISTKTQKKNLKKRKLILQKNVEKCSLVKKTFTTFVDTFLLNLNVFESGAIMLEFILSVTGINWGERLICYRLSLTFIGI